MTTVSILRSLASRALDERLIRSGNYDLVDSISGATIGDIRWCASQGEGAILVHRGVIHSKPRSITLPARTRISDLVIYQLTTATGPRKVVEVDFGDPSDELANLIVQNAPR